MASFGQTEPCMAAVNFWGSRIYGMVFEDWDYGMIFDRKRYFCIFIKK
jgi:hypothetical protein